MKIYTNNEFTQLMEKYNLQHDNDVVALVNSIIARMKEKNIDYISPRYKLKKGYTKKGGMYWYTKDFCLDKRTSFGRFLRYSESMPDELYELEMDGNEIPVEDKYHPKSCLKKALIIFVSLIHQMKQKNTNSFLIMLQPMDIVLDDREYEDGYAFIRFSEVRKKEHLDLINHIDNLHVPTLLCHIEKNRGSNKNCKGGDMKKYIEIKNEKDIKNLMDAFNGFHHSV